MTEVLPRAKKQKTAPYSTPAESAAADKAAEAVSEEDTGFTEELPPLLFVHQYRNGNFSVRECYEKYYQFVKKMLLVNREKCVTVTGTPGIGKSVFYAYFFSASGKR
ncbi:hypothetical protein PI124_g8655 [Phytophthora idaei]|nr:hypothetical protein PI125_g7845 [Phytophthora idaei]KAG3141323.1 hypothetical protein PI126_g15547 [Phytophthora idaei]KAG3246627.1 hypothetical protein PI124_g8655 [Phytophthora idaei]